MKKILVPCDFSKPSQWALETALGIARKTKSEIIVLHIIEQPTEGSFNVEGEVFDYTDSEGKLYMLQLIKKSRKQLEETLASIENPDVPIKKEMRIGNPYHGIRSIITEHKVDLVVMGTSGRTRLEEALVGSNTEKVVRHSKCPVFSIHEKPTATEYKNIVYATSLNENESSFVAIVKQMQETYNATLHLVRVNTPMNFQPDYITRKEMEVFADKFRITKCTLNIFSDYDEEEGIIHFSSFINADAIAMVTHGRTGFAHLLTRSIAEDVVNHSSRPVLTYVIRN